MTAALQTGHGFSNCYNSPAIDREPMKPRCFLGSCFIQTAEIDFTCPTCTLRIETENGPLIMLGMDLGAASYLDRLVQELKQLDVHSMTRWSDWMYDLWERDQALFVIGNGGSGTTASHIAEDLGKSTIPDEQLLDESFRRLRVQSLTDNSGWIMAVGNDLAYEQIFVQQLMNLARPGDGLLAISGSGNSANILRSVEWAQRHGLSTFGLTGYDGGTLRQIQHDGIHVCLNDMGMVESIHLTLFHWALNDLHARINERGRYQAGS